NLIAPSETDAITEVDRRQILDVLAHGQDVPSRFLPHSGNTGDVIDRIAMQREQIGNLAWRHTELFADSRLIQPVLLRHVIDLYVVGDELRHVFVSGHDNYGMPDRDHTHCDRADD